jgi:hypothetical protein
MANQNEDDKHLEAVLLEAKRLDLSSMRTLNKLINDGETDKVRLAAAKAWLDHKRELEKAHIQADSDTNRAPLVQLNLGDEANVRQIRERLLSDVPAQLPAQGDAE